MLGRWLGSVCIRPLVYEILYAQTKWFRDLRDILLTLQEEEDEVYIEGSIPRDDQMHLLGLWPEDDDFGEFHGYLPILLYTTRIHVFEKGACLDIKYTELMLQFLFYVHNIDPDDEEHPFHSRRTIVHFDDPLADMALSLEEMWNLGEHTRLWLNWDDATEHTDFMSWDSLFDLHEAYHHTKLTVTARREALRGGRRMLHEERRDISMLLIQ